MRHCFFYRFCIIHQHHCLLDSFIPSSNTHRDSGEIGEGRSSRPPNAGQSRSLDGGPGARDGAKLNEEWLSHLCLQVAGAVMHAGLADTELASSGIERVIGAPIFSLPRSLLDTGEGWCGLLHEAGALQGSRAVRLSPIPFLICGALLARCKHGGGSLGDDSGGQGRPVSISTRLSAWAFAWMRTDNCQLADQAMSKLPL
jgi:hypothetical protein